MGEDGSDAVVEVGGVGLIRRSWDLFRKRKG